jgi:hypothetical protein
MMSISQSVPEIGMNNLRKMKSARRAIRRGPLAMAARQGEERDADCVARRQ